MDNPETLRCHRGPHDARTVVAVGAARFGDGSYPVIAGPCAVESEQQVMRAAHIAAGAGASVLRGGAFKPRTSPYSFQGLGHEGLRLLQAAGRATGLPTVAEVMESETVNVAAEHVDMLQIGSRNMQNFPLLRAAGRSGKPIMLKRGLAATIDEWLLAAEYLLAEGNRDVVLCERGIRTFESRTRNTLDLSAVPVVHRISHLPVIVDPSHATGDRDLILPMALAGRAAGADGMMVEVHPEPEAARSDGPQQLDGAGFEALMTGLGITSVRDDIDRIDREIVRLVARRRAKAITVAEAKGLRGLPLRTPERERQMLEELEAEAVGLGLDPGEIRELFELMLRHSRREQQRLFGSPVVVGAAGA
jgi:3-deoxy-7-phosphoheptulonate synthase